MARLTPVVVVMVEVVMVVMVKLAVPVVLGATESAVL
jgi:hypothetical protein